MKAPGHKAATGKAKKKTRFDNIERVLEDLKSEIASMEAELDGFRVRVRPTAVERFIAALESATAMLEEVDEQMSDVIPGE